MIQNFFFFLKKKRYIFSCSLYGNCICLNGCGVSFVPRKIALHSVPQSFHLSLNTVCQRKKNKQIASLRALKYRRWISMLFLLCSSLCADWSRHEEIRPNGGVTLISKMTCPCEEKNNYRILTVCIWKKCTTRTLLLCELLFYGVFV